MLNRCLACAHAFPKNEELEWLPVGRRVAFDPHRGRLWVICGWCGHWSLVPLERRWEANDELETRVTTRAVVLGATERVSLVALGGIQALRVGRALPREEAWWRFGKSLRGRQLRYNTITRAGGAIAATAAVVGMVGMALVPGVIEIAALRRWRVTSIPRSARRSGADLAESFERWFRYGRYAWRGSAQCVDCGHAMNSLTFRDRGMALLRPDGSIQVRCRRCRSSAGWHVIAGGDAERLLRRTLAYENIAGATDDQLAAAIDLIRGGQTGRWTSATLSLRRSPREQLIALELMATQQYEARVLGWELAELDARWQIEEETAAIIDRDLTPPPGPRAKTDT